MLAELPKEIAGQFPILQYFVGAASLLYVTFAMVKSWRKTFAEDTPTTVAAAPVAPASPVANLPQYYFEGPIMHALGRLDKIEDELRELNRKVDDGFDGATASLKRLEMMIGSVSRSIRKLRRLP